MLARQALTLGVLGAATLFVAACGSSTNHYSAERFKRCMAGQHVDVFLTRDAATQSTAALVWEPTFAEWVYFFKTPGAAAAERAKLRSAIGRSGRKLARLLRTRRSNILIYAPARQDWFSPIQSCLKDARA